MSSMEDKRAAQKATDHTQKTKAAMASIERSRLKTRASAYGMSAAIAGYGDASRNSGVFGKLSRGARWFCIWFAMITPVYLFWDVIL